MNEPSDSGFRFTDLEGKSLLITGITRGIGRALLSGLLDQGLRLLAVSRGTEAMRAVREELGVEEDRMRLFNCDLGDVAAVDSTARQILETGLPVDAILHNAAIDPRQTFEKSEQAFWQQVFQVNLFSASALTRQLLPLLRRSGQGRVVFTGSVVFELGSAYLAAYAASKGAISGVTRSLAHELKGSGITVNCVAPGAIRVEKEKLDPEVDRKLIGWQTIARRLDSADLLGPICLLLSRAGAGITGQTLTVDGGLIHPLADPDAQEKFLPE